MEVTLCIGETAKCGLSEICANPSFYLDFLMTLTPPFAPHFKFLHYLLWFY